MKVPLLKHAGDEENVVVFAHRHQDGEQEERHPPVDMIQRPAGIEMSRQHGRSQRRIITEKNRDQKIGR